MPDKLRTKAKVLLVDDSIEDIAFTKAILERAKVDVDISYVRDGSEALLYLQQLPPFEDAIMPDIVFLDLSMPQMSGLEVLSVIKGRSDLRHLPVAICSGSDAPNDVKQSVELGALEYIVKPIFFDTFKKIVEKVSTLIVVEDADGYTIQWKPLNV